MSETTEAYIAAKLNGTFLRYNMAKDIFIQDRVKHDFIPRHASQASTLQGNRAIMPKECRVAIRKRLARGETIRLISETLSKEFNLSFNRIRDEVALIRRTDGIRTKGSIDKECA